MIIDSVLAISASGVPDHASTIIDRFKNTAFTQKFLIKLHEIPDKHKHNVAKQASQIRYCLVQAEEYFRSAQSVSMATRPVLLYYGAMSFALSEILLKQSGNSSLDRARGEHAHHGLDLRLEGNPSKIEDLSQSALQIRAVPMQKANGNRYGTFELWHRSSRELPVCGVFEKGISPGSSSKEISILATPKDSRPEELHPRGITLLDCFRYVPRMYQFLADHSIVSGLARSLHKTSLSESSKELTLTTIIHPTPEPTLSLTYNNILFPPSVLEQVQITDLPLGCIINHRIQQYEHSIGMSMPPCFQEHSSNMYLCSDNKSLNEFGILYAGLFILGNYARYFPDFWMCDVEGHSDLMLASRKFMEAAQHRIPILVAAELSRRCLIGEG